MKEGESTRRKLVGPVLAVMTLAAIAGTACGTAQLIQTRRGPAVYREAKNPPGLHRSLAIRSSLNWFEEDGSCWVVQAHGLPRGILRKVADSLEDYGTT